MSMVHTAYFIDWHHYCHHVLRGGWPNSDNAANWQPLLPHIKRHLRDLSKSSLPDWKDELLEIDLEHNLDRIRADDTPEDIEIFRNLNYLALLSCTTDEADGFDYFWDTLKEGLRSMLDEQAGDELVLGVYWEDKAWEFAPDLVTYQLGVLLPDMVARYESIVSQITVDDLTSALRRLDFNDNYPVYAAEIGDNYLGETVKALDKLKRNLHEARKRSCAVLYLLN